MCHICYWAIEEQMHCVLTVFWLGKVYGFMVVVACLLQFLTSDFACLFQSPTVNTTGPCHASFSRLILRTTESLMSTTRRTSPWPAFPLRILPSPASTLGVRCWAAFMHIYAHTISHVSCVYLLLLHHLLQSMRLHLAWWRACTMWIRTMSTTSSMAFARRFPSCKYSGGPSPSSF
jgi:hypothetical protein